ncbi:hypothetical protein ACI2I2_18930 [Scandinavium sp. NPDC088450]|uniref:hypothetical protein n=1 Tax=Scandinavium sp. NPDC088450 TaxID=3364514 RepID=UPI0038512CEE
MIITVLIIPLSLPVIFMALFYSATHTQWLMEFSHLAALGQWRGMTASVCLTLLIALMIISVVAAILTALFASFLNQKLLPKPKVSLKR